LMWVARVVFFHGMFLSACGCLNKIMNKIILIVKKTLFNRYEPEDSIVVKLLDAITDSARGVNQEGYLPGRTFLMAWLARGNYLILA